MSYDGLKRPVVGNDYGFRFSLLRPIGPKLNPLCDKSDLVGGQRLDRILPRRRHPLVLVVAGDATDYLARVALAGYNSRPRIAALEGRVTMVQAQTSLSILRTMTLITVRGKNGLYLTGVINRVV
jgi:hypothetical protein